MNFFGNGTDNMKKKLLIKAACVIAMCTASSGAYAQDGASAILDGYYTARSELKVDSDKDHGDGFGIKGQGNVLKNLRLTAEYQTANLNDTDFDVDQIRAGALAMTTGELRYGAGAEYVHVKVDTPFGNVKASGYSIYARGEADIGSRATVYGQAGYLSLEDDADADGFEYLVGATVKVTSLIGLFAEYRSALLKDNDDVDLDLADFRLGARLTF